MFCTGIDANWSGENLTWENCHYKQETGMYPGKAKNSTTKKVIKTIYVQILTSWS